VPNQAGGVPQHALSTRPPDSNIITEVSLTNFFTLNMSITFFGCHSYICFEPWMGWELKMATVIMLGHKNCLLFSFMIHVGFCMIICA
jgi:hypothetical protein